MFNNSNGYSLSDIAAATGNGGNGLGFNGDSAWMLILFILILVGGWNGNGNFGGGYGGGGNTGYITSDIQRGFDQSAVINGLAGITSAVNSGCANAEVSR